MLFYAVWPSPLTLGLAIVVIGAGQAALDPDENAWRAEQAMLEFVESAWKEPDEGIWEVRGPRPRASS